MNVNEKQFISDVSRLIHAGRLEKQTNIEIAKEIWNYINTG